MKTGTIEFICNLDEVDEITEYEVKYYSPDDVTRITRQHGCTSSCVYYMLRKGAMKNTDVMANGIREKIKENNRNIKSMKSSNKRLARDLKKVLDGQIERIYY